MMHDHEMIRFSVDFTDCISNCAFWDEKKQCYIIPLPSLVLHAEGIRVNNFLQAVCSDRFAKVLYAPTEEITKETEVEKDRFQNLNWET